MTTIYDLQQQTAHQTARTAAATERMAHNQQAMIAQLGAILQVNVEQLSVQKQQLDVQQQIRLLSQQQLVVSEQQLVQAIRTVRRLDVTNQRLAGIDAALTDISGQLAQQNTLMQRSLNRLTAESQELIVRGIDAYNSGWFADAASDLEKAVEKDPYSAVAYYYLAKCRLLLEEPDEARAAYEKCSHYAPRTGPIFESLALCDLASMCLQDGDVPAARQHLEAASQLAEQDRTVLVRACLRCDLAERTLRDETKSMVVQAFRDEDVDPEMLLEVITVTAEGKSLPGEPVKEISQRSRPGQKKVAGKKTPTKASLRKELNQTLTQWQSLAKEVQFEWSISHFYRELDEFVYLAPRVREGFMQAAEGAFLSLGDPLADLLDWTAMIGERLLRRIRLFTSDYLAVLPLHRILQPWNKLLVALNRQISLLASKSILVSGRFVGQLNLGLLELPAVHEDDRVIFEVNAAEGDLLALSCYYAVFARNGVDHFPIPLQDFSALRFDTYPGPQGARGVVVVDTRTQQTLMQGTVSVLMDEAGEEVSLVDLFVEAASLLSHVHESIQWAIEHEEDLFAVFVLLHHLAEHIEQATREEEVFEVVDDTAEEEFEVVDDEEEDDEFEVVE